MVSDALEMCLSAQLANHIESKQNRTPIKTQQNQVHPSGQLVGVNISCQQLGTSLGTVGKAALNEQWRATLIDHNHLA